MVSSKQGRFHTLKEKIFSRKKQEKKKKRKKRKENRKEKKNSKNLRELNVAISQKASCRRKKKSRKTQDFNHND